MPRPSRAEQDYYDEMYELDYDYEEGYFERTDKVYVDKEEEKKYERLVEDYDMLYLERSKFFSDVEENYYAD